MTATDYKTILPGLPDPDTDPQFYDRVPTRRLVAWLVDFVVVLAISLPVGLVFGIVTLGFGFAAFPLLYTAIGFFYRVFTLSGRSATLGQRFMGIEFRRFDGTRFDLTTAMLHAAIYTVSISVVLVQAASCIAILSTRYGQGIQDIILRTTAINSPAD